MSLWTPLLRKMHAKFPYVDRFKERQRRSFYGRLHYRGRAYFWAEFIRSKRRISGTCRRPEYAWKLSFVQYDRQHLSLDEVLDLIREINNELSALCERNGTSIDEQFPVRTLQRRERGT